MNKICSKCKIDKPTMEFYPRKYPNGKMTTMSHCKKCATVIHNKYYHKNSRRLNDIRNKQWDRYYENNMSYYRKKCLSRYGMTPEDYDTLFKNQEGKCKICSSASPGGKYKFFHVDHCHTTGKVRGLLCSRCNLAIGNFKDDVKLLESSITYLQNTSNPFEKPSEQLSFSLEN